MTSIPIRPVRRPIANSAVEYRTLSEIIKNSLFIYRFPDLTFSKIEKASDKTDNLSPELSFTLKNLLLSEAKYPPGGMFMLDIFRESKGFAESSELIEKGVWGGRSCHCLEEA